MGSRVLFSLFSPSRRVRMLVAIDETVLKVIRSGLLSLNCNCSNAQHHQGRRGGNTNFLTVPILIAGNVYKIVASITPTFILDFHSMLISSCPAVDGLG
jgi:hypothetical protein